MRYLNRIELVRLKGMVVVLSGCKTTASTYVRWDYYLHVHRVGDLGVFMGPSSAACGLLLHRVIPSAQMSRAVFFRKGRQPLLGSVAA